jgi:microcystin-dependent protein
MATPFLGQISVFSFSFAPKGWALCNGQLLPINQNQALFALLGTTYGGNGLQTFALPNLQGRVPIHLGNGFIQGQVGGEQAHTLAISELPSHTHAPVGSSSNANAADPTGAYCAITSSGVYSSTTSPSAALASAAVANAGGTQAHDNMAPYLVLNFCIALTGIFPSRN